MFFVFCVFFSFLSKIGNTLFSYKISVLRFCLVFPRESTIFLRIPCHFLGLFLVFRWENTIFLRLPCHFLRFSEGKHTLPWLFLGKIRFPDHTIFLQNLCDYLGYSSGRSDFPDNTIFLQNLCHFLRFCLVFPRENTFFLRIPCHFLRLFWFFVGKTLLKTLFSYGFRVISLGFFWFFGGKTLFSYGLRVISLGFQKENIRYLGYLQKKIRFS